METRHGGHWNLNFRYQTSDSFSILFDYKGKYDGTRSENSEENNTKALSDIFDNVKKNSDLKISTLRQENHQIRDQFNLGMERQSEDLQKSIVDLKSRSMRDNIVFSDIPERNDEDYKEVIQNFLKTKFKLDDISFERVHRMGKKWRVPN